MDGPRLNVVRLGNAVPDRLNLLFCLFSLVPAIIILLFHVKQGGPGLTPLHEITLLLFLSLCQAMIQCIVKSYLQWLQDSDYSPLCTLCNHELSDENCGDCVRLTCYDVFHWACLNHYAQQMPAQTAPAGYTCPLCSSCIFPQSNMASPVAEYLKTLLQQVNWARAGLGLPLIEEKEQPAPPQILSNSVDSHEDSSSQPHLRSEATLDFAPGLGVSPAPQTFQSHTPGSRPSAQIAPFTASTLSNSVLSNHHSVISVDEGTSARSGLMSNPRKLFDSTKEDSVFGNAARSHDHDEDKYKRRPALQWLGQWFHSIDSKKRKDPNAVRKRFAIILLLGIIGFITIIIIFSKLGRQATEDDPFLDPLANPNIKVQNGDAVIH